MKKSLFVLGAAVAALASCTNDEVLSVADSSAIRWNSFVNNTTRAVTEIPSGTLDANQFYVFGYYGSDVSSLTTPVYQNELGNTAQYWQPNSHYQFGAYANGMAGKIENATFDAATKVLTFADYTPDDTKDLIAAVPNTQTQTDADVTNEGAVSLSFKHMLSQVELVFKTDAADNFDLKISNVQINKAINTATGTFTAGTDPVIAWNGTAAQDVAYTYEDFAEGIDIAQATQTYDEGAIERAAGQAKLVIPQALPTTSGGEITVTFTASLKDTNDADAPATEVTFTGNLNFDGTTAGAPVDNQWTPGYRYRYTATITAEMIDEDLKDKRIEFTAEVEDWIDADGTDLGEGDFTVQPGA